MLERLLRAYLLDSKLPKPLKVSGHQDLKMDRKLANMLHILVIHSSLLRCSRSPRLHVLLSRPLKSSQHTTIFSRFNFGCRTGWRFHFCVPILVSILNDGLQNLRKVRKTITIKFTRLSHRAEQASGGTTTHRHRKAAPSPVFASQ